MYDMLYANRYEYEQQKRKAYIDACDMISVYALPRNKWNYLKFGIDRIAMKEVWNTAMKDMAGESMMDFIYERRANV